MTRTSGKTSPANDTAETPVKTAKRAVSMAAEKAPAKAAVKVSKPATKPAAKKAAKPAAAADKPEKVAKTARVKKAEDKLADLVGGGARPSSGRRPGRPAKNANNDSDGFDDAAGEGEVLPALKPPKRGGKRGPADPKDLNTPRPPQQQS